MSNDQSELTSEDFRGDVPIWNKLEYRTRKRITSGLKYILLVIAAIVVFFPIFWMFNTALRPVSSIVTQSPDVLSADLTLENYRALFAESDFLVYFQNSVIVTTGVVLLTTTFATLGGYGLTRIDIPHKKAFARGILFGYMFPAILLAIPMFILWNEIGITDTYVGLILAITARSLPFSLWLMWRFFITVPYSLEESAQIAGASRFRAFVDIALPLAKPGIIATSIFSFSVAWGDYTFSLIILADRSLFPITVGLERSFLAGGMFADWPQLMAGASIAVLPPLIFVYFLQKYFLRGFSPAGDAE